jgi:hypothetical protein
MWFQSSYDGVWREPLAHQIMSLKDLKHRCSEELQKNLNRKMIADCSIQSFSLLNLINYCILFFFLELNLY